jgi:hypothetical protein
VWLAGKPNHPEGDYAGVDGYVYKDVNVLDVLATTFDMLGVPA